MLVGYQGEEEEEENNVDAVRRGFLSGSSVEKEERKNNTFPFPFARVESISSGKQSVGVVGFRLFPE